MCEGEEEEEEEEKEGKSGEISAIRCLRERGFLNVGRKACLLTLRVRRIAAIVCTPAHMKIWLKQSPLDATSLFSSEMTHSSITICSSMR